MAYSLDDSWDNCTPVARAGNACFGLYVRCGIWVARNLTDGFVPGEIAAAYGSPEQARKLVDVGLWRPEGGGYRDLHYLDRNPLGEKVLARRKADAERRAKWRERQHKKKTRDETRESERSNAVTPQGVPASVPPLKRERGARPREAAPPPAEYREVRAQLAAKKRAALPKSLTLDDLRAATPDVPQDHTNQDRTEGDSNGQVQRG